MARDLNRQIFTLVRVLWMLNSTNVNLHCPALLTDTLNEEFPAMDIQPGITVGHEDLRTVSDLDTTHRTRRSSLRQQSARSVTNLSAEYI